MEKTANIEILRDYGDGMISYQEYVKVWPVMKSCYVDYANDLIAFALSLKTREEAFDLVDRLNEFSENAWYVGDEGEEYVYVN